VSGISQRPGAENHTPRCGWLPPRCGYPANCLKSGKTAPKLAAAGRAQRVSFPRAIAEVQKKGSIGGWRFSPDKVNVHVGDSVQAAMGRGGEGHTWTDVTAAGFQDRGCIAEINAAIFQGDDSLSPVCGPVIPEAGVPVLILQTFLPPGVQLPVDTGHAGTQLFQCMIHPWMRATVNVA
jgi:plastocyanin